MPFDGTDPRAAAAIAMIDALLAYFDDGTKWLATGEFHDAHGSRCLVSAMAHIRQRDKTAGDPTSRYIGLAVRGTPLALKRTIVAINNSCPDYTVLADILRRARARLLRERRQARPGRKTRSVSPRSPRSVRRPSSGGGRNETSRGSWKIWDANY